MLTSEEAKRQLQQFSNPNGYLEAGVRVSSLSSKHRDIGTGLLEAAEKNFRNSNAALQARSNAAKGAFEQLSDEERLKLLNAIFPGIAHHVDACWQMQKRGPYQEGYLRRPFRAPQSPEATATVRANWLGDLMRSVLPYRFDPDFLTVWAPHLSWWAEASIGRLLAAVLDSKSADQKQTYATLTTVLRGEHPIAGMGRHVTTAMLCCSQPEAWEAIEKLLLAAQRQEGLRQVILETIDFAHPQAFIRMLRLIEREKLTRFAAVARGVAVWLGMSPDSSDSAWLEKQIATLAENLQNPSVCSERLASENGETVYLALWSIACFNAADAARAAETVLQRTEFEPRYAAARLLSQLGIPSAVQGLRMALSDPDLRVAIEATNALPHYHFRGQQGIHLAELFDTVAALVERTPKKKALGSVLWEFNKLEANQGIVAERLIGIHLKGPWSRVTAYLPVMSVNGRDGVASALISESTAAGFVTPEVRKIALDLLEDPSSSVRSRAFWLLQKAVPTPAEAETLEPLLSRKSSDIRRGIIQMLLNQPEPDAMASAKRLFQSGDALMKQAGDELFSVLRREKPASAAASRPQTAPPSAPQERFLPLLQKGAAPRILQALDALVESMREVAVSYTVGEKNTRTELLGNIQYFYPRPDCDMPLREVWLEWWNARPMELRDPDGLELARAAFAVALAGGGKARASWHDLAVADLRTEVTLRFKTMDAAILHWLLMNAPPERAIPHLLDGLESTLYGVSRHHVPEENVYAFENWQSSWPFSNALTLLHLVHVHNTQQWTVTDCRRYWNLLRWVDQGLPGKHRHRPSFETTVEMHKLGIATDAEIYEHLLGGEGDALSRYGRYDFVRLTRRKKDKLFEKHPPLQRLVDDCRDWILESELQRGDLPTALSGAALAMTSVSRSGLSLRILKALGNEKFARGYIYDAGSRTSVLSHLLRISLPHEDDTLETFRRQAQELALPDSRLVDLAVYAPHWAPFVKHATGIRGLETVAFWLHAHTKDQYWEVDEQIRELWFAEVSERTPLSRQDLLDGAVDVQWFREMYAAVGHGVWEVMLESARYASSSGGHKRAELFAAALLNRVNVAELNERIRDKRHQDSVRALGLIPLPKASTKVRKELLARYEVLQKYIKESRQFGAQRQASERLAADIGMANLARTAGYADPQRLSWAMEMEALGDLRHGAIEAAEGDVRVTLSIDAEGEVHLAIEKKGKALKEIPAALKKVPAIAALRTRKTELAQQTSRMRRSLEQSMVRGDVFTAAELRELSAHPLLRPMLRSLLFVAPEDGVILQGSEIGGNKGNLRIAHPVDLLASGKWREYQQACIAESIRQPFKQAFRELYILTEAERDQKEHSSRYEGQQVNPAQALATLAKRGWVNVPEEGLRRTFHFEGISAWVTFLNGWFTPADVDGLTVDKVLFTRRDNGRIVEVEKVNPRVFSEVMRDLDLMVSVAHRGGVDPEASASTTEMRAALLRETMALLGINNVRLAERHALVDGTLGSYNIHLGSGVVHRQPGGSVCIIPVHSQHRGRLFLPFADDDPKTAEIVSKVLLLANDKAIQDPTILEQLR